MWLDGDEAVPLRDARTLRLRQVAIGCSALWERPDASPRPTVTVRGHETEPLETPRPLPVYSVIMKYPHWRRMLSPVA